MSPIQVSADNIRIDEAALARARAAARELAPLAARIEAERRLPPEAVAALLESGVFKLLLPRELGGAAAGAATYLEALIELARADGSAGWCAMLGATTALIAGYLPEAEARAVFAPAEAVACGVFAPMGRAAREAGGWRVSGRWSFASGCQHSPWRMGGVVTDGGVRHVLMRAGDTQVVETWDAVGLRGTGSHDLVADGALVPEARLFDLIGGTSRPLGPISSVPIFGVLAAGVAAVALGIARAAMDELAALAASKQPPGAKRSIAHRESVQLAVARAEGKVGAAHAYLREALAAAAADASLPARARARVAACHATSEAAAAVDLMYEAGGGSAVYARSPLSRQFRDVHTATQHVMVSPVTAVTAGRVLLGLDTDVSTL